jgi:mannose-6-phosphate isomerase-like protein (cupin superfamily)
VSVGEFSFEPTRVDKPWGWELIWALTDTYCGKLLFVSAGESLSLQYHERKDESWYVQEGRAELELSRLDDDGRDLVEIAPGDCFRFAPGTVHRLRALDDTLIVEVSTPDLDDVVRLEDAYGRAGTAEP